VGLGDEFLLDDRDLREVHLHPQIAARDHDGVGGLEDRVDIGHRLGLLDLGDDGDECAGARLFEGEINRAHARERLAELTDLGRVPNEGEGQEVQAVRDRPLDAFPISFGDRRSFDIRIRQVDALGRRYLAADDYAAAEGVCRVGPGRVERDQAHSAVVDEDAVAGEDLDGEPRVRAGERGGPGAL
jgi:hypothetical protein